MTYLMRHAAPQLQVVFVSEFFVSETTIHGVFIAIVTILVISMIAVPLG
jgi:hypothetical protein